MKKIIVCLILVLTTRVSWGQRIIQNVIQNITDCEMESHQADTLWIRTGYDNANGTLYPDSTQDPYWEMTQAPSNVNLPSPVWVITQNTSWGVLPNSSWISAYEFSDYNVNNPAPQPPYTFQRCFCVCDSDTVSVHLEILVDDIVDVYFDNILLGAYHAGWYFGNPPKIIIDTVLAITGGTHCLRFDVRNSGGFAFGLDVSGYVKGERILKQNYCNPRGSICGMKYNDLNGNGVRDEGEPGLAGWSIVLKYPWGEAADTVVTDQFGNYCFRNLYPYEFVVQEINRLNWNQRQPASPAGYNIEVEAYKVKTAKFGNQNNCQVAACATDTLRLNTGYDYTTGSLYAINAQDAFWQLVQSPTNVNLPAPAWVINPNGAWNVLPGSRWISPFTQNLYGVNNPVPQAPYGFQYCFCTCSNDSVSLHLEILVDDVVDVLLDGTLLGSYTAGYYFTTGNRIIIDRRVKLTASTHCLRFNVRNTGGVALGLNVSGYVSGAGAQNAVCCNPSGSICGIKYEDVNGNGIRDGGEPVIPNWSIILSDTNGNAIDTVVTDSNGNYCFNGLFPNKYVVTEINNRPGWGQVQPADPTGYHVTLAAKKVISAPFGNSRCGGNPDPCFDLPDSICIHAPIVPVITCNMGDVVWHQWVITELNGAWENRVVKGNFPFNGVPSSFNIRTLWNGFVQGKCYGISLDIFDSCGKNATHYEFFCFKAPVVHIRNYTICANIDPCRTFNMNDPAWPCMSGTGSWDVVPPGGLGFSTMSPMITFCAPSAGPYSIKTVTADGCECTVTGNITVDYNCLPCCGGGNGGNGKRALSAADMNDNSEFVISPNPSDGLFNLHHTGFIDEGTSVVVYDVLGRLVMQTPVKATMQIDLTDNQAGIYTVVITGKRQYGVYKIVLTQK